MGFGVAGIHDGAPDFAAEARSPTEQIVDTETDIESVKKLIG
jgi:hypothetical protein